MASLKHRLNHLTLLPIALTLLYIGLCSFTFWNWERHNWFHIRGDEPAYLLLADSISQYGSFELTLSLQKQLETGSIISGLASFDQAAFFFHAIEGKHGFFSAHNIGLPLLLSIPYSLGGTVAAKVSLILLSSLTVVFSWLISGHFTSNLKVRLISTVSATFSLPFISASSQVYPDLVAGVIALSAITFLMLDGDNSIKARLAEFSVSLAIAFLPWLQIKFSACAIILALSLYFKVKTKTRSITRSMMFLFFTTISLLLVASYNIYSFGRISGIYENGSLEISRHSLMVLVGLHLDRFQGIFIQNPAYLVGLIFLIPFVRRNWFAGATVILVYGSLVVPNALHTNWYGGDSFAGRFVWAGATVMLPIVIFGLCTCLLYLHQKAIYLFCVLFFMQVCNYTLYTFHNFPFYNINAFRPWLDRYQSFYPVLKRFLPALYDSRWAYSYPPNIAFFLICLILIAFGLSTPFNVEKIRKKIYFFFLFSITLVSFCGTFGTPPYFPYEFAATDLQSQTGVVVDTSRIARSGVDSPGFLAYAIPVSWYKSMLTEGRYVLRLDYVAEGLLASEQIGWTDIFVPQLQEVVKSQEIKINSEHTPLEMSFEMPSKFSNEYIDFRIYYGGKGTLMLNSIAIEKVEPG